MSETRLKSKNWDSVARQLDDISARDGTWHQRFDINPTIIEFISDLNGKNALDLCCGTGHFSRIMSNLGASVTGIDFSKVMIRRANEIDDQCSLVEYFVMNASNLGGLDNTYFDICVCNMGPMDIEDCYSAFNEVSRVLRPNGKFIFSMTHPSFARQPWRYIEVEGEPQFAKAVIRYLGCEDEEDTFAWADDLIVPQYHRPLHKYFSWLRKSGFLIEGLSEIGTMKPLKQTDDPNLSRTRRAFFIDDEDRAAKERAGKQIPSFLIISARKLSLKN